MIRKARAAAKPAAAKHPSWVATLGLLLVTAGSWSCDEQETQGGAVDPAPKGDVSSEAPPRRLYIEDDDGVVDLEGRVNPASGVDFGGPEVAPSGPLLAHGACPSDMVFVAGSFCIDRYEVQLVDAHSGQALSPHYPPVRPSIQRLFEQWSTRGGQTGLPLDRSLDVPVPPAFSLTEDFQPRARAARGVLPAAYLSRGTSELSCMNAGKRLCHRHEWVRACRGQTDTRFPYGDEYRAGACNVHRENHPARLLHGDASRNHLDPRLGLVQDDQGPLLHRTGDFPECASRWGADAVYDMVGNLDEWISDSGGAFVGGFFSRATKSGCAASIDSHDPGYQDYSLGTRCCADPR